MNFDINVRRYQLGLAGASPFQDLPNSPADRGDGGTAFGLTEFQGVEAEQTGLYRSTAWTCSTSWSSRAIRAFPRRAGNVLGPREQLLAE